MFSLKRLYYKVATFEPELREYVSFTTSYYGCTTKLRLEPERFVYYGCTTKL